MNPSLNKQVREEALKVARALECFGLRKGDVVAVILPNCLEYPILIQVVESFPFNRLLNCSSRAVYIWASL